MSNPIYMTAMTGTDGLQEMRLLKVDEVIREGDLYLSTSGTWQPAPIWGPTVKQGSDSHAAQFARPKGLDS